MNKKVLIIIGVVVILGLAFYLSMNKSSAPSPLANNKLSDDSKMASNQSLKDLLLRGKAMKCEFKDNGISGIFYMADQKMRGNTEITANDKTMESHMIVVDKTSYTWVEGQKTGFKIAATDADIKNNSNPESANKSDSVSLDKPMNYKCSDWSKDDSYFSLPADVQFSDLNSLMPGGVPKVPVTSTENSSKPSTGNDLKTAQCAACDSVPAASRAQCKTALGCK